MPGVSGRILPAEITRGHALELTETPVEVGKIAEAGGTADLLDGAVGLDQQAARRPDTEFREVFDEGL